MAAPPEADLALIRTFCEGQVPEHLRGQIQVEHRVRGRSVTILERRPAWGAEPGTEWTEMPVARSTFDARTNGWTLYCLDRDSRAVRYEPLAPHQRITRLLAEYDEDPTGIFQG